MDGRRTGRAVERECEHGPRRAVNSYARGARPGSPISSPPAAHLPPSTPGPQARAAARTSISSTPCRRRDRVAGLPQHPRPVERDGEVGQHRVDEEPAAGTVALDQRQRRRRTTARPPARHREALEVHVGGQRRPGAQQARQRVRAQPVQRGEATRHGRAERLLDRAGQLLDPHLRLAVGAAQRHVAEADALHPGRVEPAEPLVVEPGEVRAVGVAGVAQPQLGVLGRVLHLALHHPGVAAGALDPGADPLLPRPRRAGAPSSPAAGRCRRVRARRAPRPRSAGRPRRRPSRSRGRCAARPGRPRTAGCSPPGRSGAPATGSNRLPGEQLGLGHLRQRAGQPGQRERPGVDVGARSPRRRARPGAAPAPRSRCRGPARCRPARARSPARAWWTPRRRRARGRWRAPGRSGWCRRRRTSRGRRASSPAA